MSQEKMQERFSRRCEEYGLPELPINELEIELELSLEDQPSKISSALTLDQKKENLDWVRRFRAVWKRVKGETRAIQLLCIEAIKHGYLFHTVDDGEESHSIADGSVEEVIELATAVDESSITFKGKASGKIIRFYLVFGNSPEELIADHTDHPDAELIWQAVQKRV